VRFAVCCLAWCQAFAFLRTCNLYRRYAAVSAFSSTISKQVKVCAVCMRSRILTLHDGSLAGLGDTTLPTKKNIVFFNDIFWQQLLSFGFHMPVLVWSHVTNLTTPGSEHTPYDQGRFCYSHRRVEPVHIFTGNQTRCRAALEQLKAGGCTSLIQLRPIACCNRLVSSTLARIK
jgi:hypothetical protein